MFPPSLIVAVDELIECNYRNAPTDDGEATLWDEARAGRRHHSRLGEIDKIGLISPIAKQALVGRLLCYAWF
jgi:hypothetical protein